MRSGKAARQDDISSYPLILGSHLLPVGNPDRGCCSDAKHLRARTSIFFISAGGGSGICEQFQAQHITFCAHGRRGTEITAVADQAVPAASLLVVVASSAMLVAWFMHGVLPFAGARFHLEGRGSSLMPGHRPNLTCLLGTWPLCAAFLIPQLLKPRACPRTLGLGRS